MLTRNDLKPWVLDALRSHSGRAHIIDIAKHIWANHKRDLEAAGDFFFKWQYELRWAGERLTKEKKMKKLGSTGVWVLP